jgi:hypothetical protein
VQVDAQWRGTRRPFARQSVTVPMVSPSTTKCAIHVPFASTHGCLAYDRCKRPISKGTPKLRAPDAQTRCAKPPRKPCLRSSGAMECESQFGHREILIYSPPRRRRNQCQSGLR